MMLQRLNVPVGRSCRVECRLLGRMAPRDRAAARLALKKQVHTGTPSSRDQRSTCITCAAAGGGPDVSATGVVVGARTSGTGRTPRMSSLASSLQLAWCRAQETKKALSQQQGDSTGPAASQALVADPYAEALLGAGNQSAHACEPLTHLAHVLATRYIDDTLQAAMAATSVNTISKGDYRQVVIVGDGLDTRPFRMLWPEGTVIYLVAPRESHEAAMPLLKAAGAHVPRGCLLRRVASDTATADEGFLGKQLEAAGYQASRLSVWVMQGLANQGMTRPAVEHLLMDVTTTAAFHSLVLGEFPALMTSKQAENLLAEFGLLSTVLPFEHPSVSLGRWTGEHTQQAAGPQQRWLFTSQQMRLSLEQEGLYEQHVSVQVDEDFFGNVS